MNQSLLSGALHMGPLHPYEQVLTLLLAFGPFVLLGVVIAVRRRNETDPGEGDGAARMDGTDRTNEDRPRTGQPAR